MLNSVVLAVFIFVYLGMVLGKIPGLALDRAGVALVGAIVLVATRQMSPEVAWDAVDVPTIILLFGLMVVSAQFRLCGFYASLTRRLAAAEVLPHTLLALLITVVGVLSALLVNDIVCLAVTPVLVEGCARRGLDPVPFLLALACAANVGSAATLIGNPQNMLIGQALHLSFAGYLLEAIVPTMLSLVAVWLVIWWRTRGQWYRPTSLPSIPESTFATWQAGKGLLVLALLVSAFLVTPWPREVLALIAAGILLTSRRIASRTLVGLVDGQLLLLFVSLFVVNHALVASGLLEQLIRTVETAGMNLSQPVWLFVSTVVLSNLVSNVPAVMLLLPVAVHPLAGPILGLASTLASNLFLVGSIANIVSP